MIMGDITEQFIGSWRLVHHIHKDEQQEESFTYGKAAAGLLNL